MLKEIDVLVMERRRRMVLMMVMRIKMILIVMIGMILGMVI